MMDGISSHRNPESWEMVRLGSLVEREKGKKPKKQASEQSSSYSLPYINIQAFEGGIIDSWTDGDGCRMCHESDFLMVWDGSRSGLVGRGMKGALGSTLVRINFPLIENQYAFYFLQSKYEQINSRTKGSGTPHVDPNLLWNYEFPVPPLNEQRGIVAKIEELFSELDKGVENIEKARELLKVYRQAVLKHAFEGKLTAQWRADNKDKLENPEQLLARVKQERSARYDRRMQEWKDLVKDWEESGRKGKKPPKPGKLPEVADIPDDLVATLPKLPGSWAWAKLGWLTCGMEYGTSAKSAKSGTAPVLRMGNIQNAKFDWTDLVYTSDEDEIAKYLLHDGDVLFNRTNSPELVGKTAIYNSERAAIFAGYLIRVNHIRRVADSQYVSLFLNSHVARQYGNSVKTDGVNQSNINATKLSNYPFPNCSIDEQHEMVRILEKALSLVDTTEAEINRELQKAAALRQSILKKAFSGQLVAQDPNDEPASVLLDRIKAQKVAQSQSARLRKKRRRAKVSA